MNLTASPSERDRQTYRQRQTDRDTQRDTHTDRWGVGGVERERELNA